MALLTHAKLNGDWEGIYVNGKLKVENHMNRIWPKDVLELVGTYEIDDVDYITIEGETELPEQLEDVDADKIITT